MPLGLAWRFCPPENIEQPAAAKPIATNTPLHRSARLWNDGRIDGLLCSVVDGEGEEAACYQMPSPMSTMPMKSHPSTPTEMIVSSVMPVSEGLEFCCGSLGFM
jgi:hypothetical protein